MMKTMSMILCTPVLDLPESLTEVSEKVIMLQNTTDVILLFLVKQHQTDIAVTKGTIDSSTPKILMKLL